MKKFHCWSFFEQLENILFVNYYLSNVDMYKQRTSHLIKLGNNRNIFPRFFHSIYAEV